MTNNNSNTGANRPRQEAPKSKLRTARLAKGLSQVDLAFKSGVSLSWLSVLERKPGLMTQRIAERLAAALDLPVKALWP